MSLSAEFILVRYLFPSRLRRIKENGGLKLSRSLWGLSEYKSLSMNVAGGLLPYLEEGNKVKPVVVCMKKSKEMLCTFMGIMYCGGSYVPAQSDIPLSRLEKIVENLCPRLIVFDENTKIYHCVLYIHKYTVSVFDI